jgi:GPI-anchor transamidase subunit GAA1
LCAAAVGYGWGAGYLKFLVPPEKILKWLEENLRLRQRLQFGGYVSVERSTYGRFGVLPTGGSSANGGAIGLEERGQR